MIRNVQFLDESGNPLDALLGGEVVELEITGDVQDEVKSPIVGFYLQDRLGQTLFADNTAMGHDDASAQPLASGSGFRATFRFQMPWMPAGEYAIGVAIADGTMEDNIPLHWVESAMVFRIHGSHVAVGLVGLPMLSVTLDAVSNVEETGAGT